VTILLADFESANLEALKEAGYSGIIRYLAFLPNPKVIMASEYNQAAALGLTLTLTWEQGASDGLGGADTGAAHGTEANRQADLLGHPMDRPIFYSFDFDVQPNQYDVCEQYLRAAGGPTGTAAMRPAAAYGPQAFLVEMIIRKACWVNIEGQGGWDPSSWLFGKMIDTRMVMFQRLTPTEWRNGGQFGDIDEDVVVNDATDYGQYPYPAPQPIPPEDRDVLTIVTFLMLVKNPPPDRPDIKAGDLALCASDGKEFWWVENPATLRADAVVLTELAAKVIEHAAGTPNATEAVTVDPRGVPIGFGAPLPNTRTAEVLGVATA
jgi:hypothetical protein